MFTDPERAVERGPQDITTLLNRMRNGDRAAGEEVASLVYTELHRIASRAMRHERERSSMQTTALVHEAYLKLVGADTLEIQSRAHFFAVASQQMRRILVDHARSRDAVRRGGGASNISLEGLQIVAAERSVDVLLLDECLSDLERLEPRAAKVVELRYFGGYTDKEVMEALGISRATLHRDWQFARAWLFDRMRQNGPR